MPVPPSKPSSFRQARGSLARIRSYRCPRVQPSPLRNPGPKLGTADGDEPVQRRTERRLDASWEDQSIPLGELLESLTLAGSRPRHHARVHGNVEAQRAHALHKHRVLRVASFRRANSSTMQHAAQAAR